VLFCSWLLLVDTKAAMSLELKETDFLWRPLGVVGGVPISIKGKEEEEGEVGGGFLKSLS